MNINLQSQSKKFWIQFFLILISYSLKAISEYKHFKNRSNRITPHIVPAVSGGGSSGILWIEGFNSLSNGTTIDNGSANWSIENTGTGDFQVSQDECSNWM